MEATGQFLTELCERLAERYEVTVIAGRSYYAKREAFRPYSLYSSEIFNGINILRVRHTRFWKGNLLGRFINWFTYTALSFLAALVIKPSLMVACTDPPFLGIIAMVISRLKSAPFIYNTRDLYPDVAIELGKLKRGFLSCMFDYLNKKALYAAAIVVPLGQSMEDRLISKGVPKERIRVIPDWVDTSMIKPIPKKENPLAEKFGLADKFVIMYSGNIGLSQDFSLILRSITTVKSELPFYLVFIGEGSVKEKLIHEVKSLGLKNVMFLSYQPLETLSFSLGLADLHLIPLKKGMAGTIVPSKVYGIMAAGRPYLAITDKESEPARIALEFKCGLWTEPENSKALSEGINWALNHPAELGEMGKAGRRLAETKFDKGIVINDWFKLLGAVLKCPPCKS